MIPEENVPAPAGHNKPPSPVESLVTDQREALEQYLPRLAEVIEAMDDKVVDDGIRAGQAGDLLKIGAELSNRIEDDRKQRTQPFRKAADGAKAVVDDALRPLDEAAERLRLRLAAWTKQQEDLAAKQRAEQQAFLGDVAAGPDDISAKPLPKREPKKVVAVGDLGAKVTKEEAKHYEITDVNAIPSFILESPTVTAAIIQVAKSMSKHVPHIAGIKVTTTTENRIR